MVEEVLQLRLGESAFLGGLFVVLHVRGGVPLEEYLGRMTSEALLAHPVPAVIGMADIGAEQFQGVLITADGGLLAPVDRAQITEELLSDRRCPCPRELVGNVDEPLHDPDPPGDRLVIEVAAQLLIAPPLEHLLDGLRLGM